MKHLGSLVVIAILFSFAAAASSRVCVDHNKKTVTLSAHYYFYGDQATRAHVKPCIDEINHLFNNGSQIQLNKDGVWKKVIVKVTAEIANVSQAVNLATFNYDPRINFVRIDTPTKGSRVTVSEHGLNSNYGYFIVSNGLGESTTCTHEFAHGLGLNHISDPCDWRGKGVPPIMAPRGCKVDKKYQYDPKAKAGAEGGTINPSYRQVKPNELSAINMGDLDFHWEAGNIECASQGRVSHKMYNKDGTTYQPGGLPYSQGGMINDSTHQFHPTIEVVD